MPPGAQKAEVWRNENYGIRAKFSGTTEGSRIDIHPEREVGALIPLFEINGSDERGIIDYKIGPCALDEVRASSVTDRDTGAPTADYEADLYVLGARWTARHGDPAEAEWLSEWYLNGPRLPLMYPRGSGTKLTERSSVSAGCPATRKIASRKPST